MRYGKNISRLQYGSDNLEGQANFLNICTCIIALFLNRYVLIENPLPHHPVSLFVYLFGVLHRFQHCTGHITTGSWKGRGNQYIQFVRVLYCKLPTNGKQLPSFPLEAMPGTEPQPQRWEARVLPLCHLGPLIRSEYSSQT